MPTVTYILGLSGGGGKCESVLCTLSFSVFFILGMHLGIMAIQFAAGGLHRELPVDFDLLSAAFIKQCQCLGSQFLDRCDAAVEAQSRQYREFTFDHIQPRGTLGCVVKL